MESRKVYTDQRFFAIVSFLFNLIASGKKSEYTVNPHQFTEEAKQEIVLEEEIEKEKHILKLTVLKSVPVEKTFTKGRVFVMDEKGTILMFSLINFLKVQQTRITSVKGLVEPVKSSSVEKVLTPTKKTTSPSPKSANTLAANSSKSNTSTKGSMPRISHAVTPPVYR